MLNEDKEKKEQKEEPVLEKEVTSSEPGITSDSDSNLEENEKETGFVLDFSKAHKKVFTAKRKRCVCRVVIKQNNGLKLVNGKDYKSVFNSPLLVSRSTHPMSIIKADFGFKANVNGGGVSAISDAVKYALAKAIITICPEARKPLKEQGLLKSDSRKVLPKKPGRPKAVKLRQKSKR